MSESPSQSRAGVRASQRASALGPLLFFATALLTVPPPPSAALADDPDDEQILVAIDAGGHTGHVTRLIVDQYQLISVSHDKTIRIWDLAQERLTLTGHQGAVRAIAVADDQSFLASAGNDGTIRIWRTLADTAAP